MNVHALFLQLLDKMFRRHATRDDNYVSLLRNYNFFYNIFFNGYITKEYLQFSTYYVIVYVVLYWFNIFDDMYL